jgi:hypothetical protein
MIYITHGKYLYGTWMDNQPHGLNVFRVGEAVLLGQFEMGKLTGKVIVIFERLGFLAIVMERSGDEWLINDRKVLRDHKELVPYIQFVGIGISPLYFSLAKYMAAMQGEGVVISQCK